MTIAAFVIAIVALVTARALCRRVAALEAELARLSGSAGALGPADGTGEPIGWPLLTADAPVARRR